MLVKLRAFSLASRMTVVYTKFDVASTACQILHSCWFALSQCQGFFDSIDMREFSATQG